MVYTVYTMDCAPEATVLSRVFRSGNSQAVRIPKDLAFDPAVQEGALGELTRLSVSYTGIVKKFSYLSGNVRITVAGDLNAVFTSV